MRSSAAFVIAAALPAAYAAIAITDPNGLTTCSGGKPCTVNWKDDGLAPSLADSGVCDYSVYTGTQQQQTFLQRIAPTVNVVTTAALVFTPDPTIGPNSNTYFIRAQCNVPDPASPTLPLLAFSHRFTLNNMAGTFNASIQEQIAAVPTTDLPGGTLQGAAPSSTSAAPTSSAPVKSSASTTTSGAKSTPTSGDNSAVSNGVNGAVFLAAAAFAALLI